MAEWEKMGERKLQFPEGPFVSSYWTWVIYQPWKDYAAAFYDDHSAGQGQTLQEIAGGEIYYLWTK